jgi:twitching motility protein PilT
VQRIEKFLRLCVEMEGSDLHFKCDTGKAYVRVHGDLIPLEGEAFNDQEFQDAFYSLLRPEQVKRFQEDLELDFALEIPGLSRFRGNAYQQRGHVQGAFRVIPYDIQSMEDLHLPAACYDFIERPRGLVLVTGPAGSGKTTSLAAMIDRINRTKQLHIMTVEDPVEFVHDDHVALINQRELEVDTLAFANALKYVLRQDPDVILVGEMRDLETIHLAITAAETGHLVFATLHTVDSVQTVDRIVDVFPIHQQQQIRMQLSVNLVGVLSQTLIKRSDGRGRVAAFEVLVANSAVRNLVRENKSYQIASLIQTGSRSKMHTLDQSLASLVDRGLAKLEDARAKAKDPQEFDRLVSTEGELATAAANAPRPAAPPPPGKGAPPPEAPQPPPVVVRGQPNRPGYRKE